LLPAPAHNQCLAEWNWHDVRYPYVVKEGDTATAGTTADPPTLALLLFAAQDHTISFPACDTYVQ
jgi:hypothetical protein